MDFKNSAMYDNFYFISKFSFTNYYALYIMKDKYLP